MIQAGIAAETVFESISVATAFDSDYSIINVDLTRLIQLTDNRLLNEIEMLDVDDFLSDCR